MIINFYVQTKVKLPFKHSIVKQIISRSVKVLKVRYNFEITILLVGTKKITALNKKFRNKNKITDVLSFSQQEGKQFILPPQEKKYLGDLIICYPQIKKQAKFFSTSIQTEFSLILIHGFLHLLGYNDETLKGEKEMQKLQEKILTQL
ncbi:MAG: rRNA maturation RNase YbeY [Patescibacteria group bacterium]